MRRVLFILFILILSGCETESNDTLKQEIKDELYQELVAELEDTHENFNTHLSKISSHIQSCSVGLVVGLSTSTVLGSGVVYASHDTGYYILTNAHILRYYNEIEVHLPNNESVLYAELIREDLDLDLAMLSITTEQSINLCEVQSINFTVGEFVFAIGTQAKESYMHSITLGIISRTDEETIQHDAAINVGSSGGGLFNLNGELIGINKSKLHTTSNGGSSINVEGVGFAIPINIIQDFIENVEGEIQ